MTAASGFLTALECTKFVLGRGSAPNPVGGAYSASLTPNWFKWALLLRGGQGREGKGGEGRGGEGQGDEGKEREGRKGEGKEGKAGRPS